MLRLYHSTAKGKGRFPGLFLLCFLAGVDAATAYHTGFYILHDFLLRAKVRLVYPRFYFGSTTSKS